MNYVNIHDAIIANAKSLSRCKTDGVYENHHIIPRCFGGSNANENMVLLTPREHFLIHKILVRMYPTSIPLNRALWTFINGSRSTLRVTNSNQYERCRRLVMLHMTNNNPMHNPVHKNKKQKSTKHSIEIGTFIPHLSTPEGRASASARMTSDRHPMKNAAIVNRKALTDLARGNKSWMTTDVGKKYISSHMKSNKHPLKLRPWNARTAFKVLICTSDDVQMCFRTLKDFYSMYGINKDVAAKIIKTGKIPTTHQGKFKRIEKI